MDCHGRGLSPPAHDFCPPLPLGLGEAIYCLAKAGAAQDVTQDERRKCGQILASTFLPAASTTMSYPII